MSAIRNFIISFCVTFFCVDLPALNAVPLSDPNVFFASQSSMASSEMDSGGNFQSTIQSQSTGPDGNTVTHAQSSNGGSTSVSSIQGRMFGNVSEVELRSNEIF